MRTEGGHWDSDRNLGGGAPSQGWIPSFSRLPVTRSPSSPPFPPCPFRRLPPPQAFKVLQITKAGLLERVTCNSRALGLHPRDVALFDASSAFAPQRATIVAREGAILVRLANGAIQAIVRPTQVMLLDRKGMANVSAAIVRRARTTASLPFELKVRRGTKRGGGRWGGRPADTYRVAARTLKARSLCPPCRACRYRAPLLPMGLPAPPPDCRGREAFFSAEAPASAPAPLSPPPPSLQVLEALFAETSARFQRKLAVLAPLVESALNDLTVDLTRKKVKRGGGALDTRV